MNIFLVPLIRVPKPKKCFQMHFYNDLYSHKKPLGASTKLVSKLK